MRILYADHYAGSPELGMEFRPWQLAREWTRAGHRVTVIAGTYSHLRVRNPEHLRVPTLETVEGVEFLWIPTPRYSGNGPGRIRSMVAYCLGLRRALARLAAEGPVDAIIASSTYPFDFLVTHAAARRCGAASVFELHDLWPASPMAIGGYSRWHPFIVATQWCEDRFCRDADLVVSIIPHADRHLVTRGLRPERYVHIPNGIDPADVPEATPTPGGPLGDAAKWCRERFTVGFAGSVSDAYALETLVQAVGIAGIRGLVVGDGPLRSRLEELARSAGADMRFTGRVKRTEAIALLRACSATFVGLKGHPLFEAYGISMNKIYDGMLCGRPMLASYTSANDPVADAGCGLSVRADDVKGLVDAIGRMVALGEAERDAMGRRGRDFVIAHHEHRTLAARMAEAIGRARPGR